MSIYSKILQDLFKNKIDEKAFQHRTTQSLDWYRKKMKSHFGETKLRIEDKAKLTKTNNVKNTTINQGWIYSFTYRPKYKDKLPYYDAFPLVLVLQPVPGGFLGLNFHYLRPIDRALFMDKLYDFVVPDTKNKTLRINMKYPILQQFQRLRYYKACIKRYRYFNIGSFFVPLEPEEWDMALFLPTENFKKDKQKNVWEDSRSKY